MPKSKKTVKPNGMEATRNLLDYVTGHYRKLLEASTADHRDGTPVLLTKPVNHQVITKMEKRLAPLRTATDSKWQSLLAAAKAETKREGLQVENGPRLERLKRAWHQFIESLDEADWHERPIIKGDAVEFDLRDAIKRLGVNLTAVSETATATRWKSPECPKCQAKTSNYNTVGRKHYQKCRVCKHTFTKMAPTTAIDSK